MIFDMKSCGGCRTCELACSFHHEKNFNPKISSLKILDKKDEKGYLVEILSEKIGLRYACDGCSGLKTSLCVQYCKEPEILMGFIERTINKDNLINNE